LDAPSTTAPSEDIVQSRKARAEELKRLNAERQEMEAKGIKKVKKRKL
jgi:hypothetical protein